MKFFRNLLRDEAGQSTTEYILILAVVVMIAMRFRTIIGSKLESVVNQVGNNMEQAVSNTNP